MKKILLIDDSPIVLTSMKKIVGHNGYDIDTSLSGEDAMEKINAGYRPDLIITDLNMPGMDGVDVIKEARGVGACRFIPILILTTESSAAQKERARAAGATGWLVKPVMPDKLFSVLNQVLPA